MEKINAVITGVGGYVPNYILDNEEMSTIVETSDEWIMERIGVKTRHILKPEEGAGKYDFGIKTDTNIKPGKRNAPSRFCSYWLFDYPCNTP